MIAEYSTTAPQQNPTTSYTITDQLGSPRVIVDALGQVVSRRDFLPFGEEVEVDGTYRTPNQKYGQTDSVRQRFTGYQKDEETQLDFAEARMYENRHARFTAVDPLLSSGKSANPQTFNRYVYVMNNPLAYTDPTGLQAATAPFLDIYPCDKGACDFTVSGERLIFNNEPIAVVNVTAEPTVLEVSPPAALGTTITFPFTAVLPEAGAGAGTTSTFLAPAAGGLCAIALCYLLANRIADYTPGGINDATMNRTIWRDGQPYISTIGGSNTGANDPALAIPIPGRPTVPTIMHLLSNREQRQIAEIARTIGISYGDLTEEIHKVKASFGLRGDDNLTPEEIKEIAKEVKANKSGGNK